MRTTVGNPILSRFTDLPPVAEAVKHALGGRRVGIEGIQGSSTAYLAAAIAHCAARPTLLVVAHVDEADEIVDELGSIGVAASRFCALESLPGESQISLDLFAERLKLVQRIVRDELDATELVVAPIHALMQRAPAAEVSRKIALALSIGDARGPQEIVRWLDSAGYQRLDTIEEPSDFAVRGGIIDVFPAGATGDAGDVPPFRLDFFGDDLESIAEVDLESMGSGASLQTVEIIGADAATIAAESASVSLMDLLPEGWIAVLQESIEIAEQGRGYYERVVGDHSVMGPPATLQAIDESARGVIEVNHFSPTSARCDATCSLPVSALPEISENVSEAVEQIEAHAESHEVLVCCQNDAERERLDDLLAQHAPDSDITSATIYVHRGFVVASAPDSVTQALLVLPYHELLHRYQVRRRTRRLRAGRAMDTFLEVQPDDYVVHADHGVAKFVGLKTMRKGEGAEAQEYLTLEFAGRAKMHVPASQIDRVQKYVGSAGTRPTLSTIGGLKWSKQKEKVREAVRDLAAELLRVQAAREHLPGVGFPDDTPWQRQFEGEFPYEETPDQLAALSEIKRDMRAGRPMDRLVCGDVGYGKTEVAIRAAFKAVEFGKQVALCVPTTVLAEQHEMTFRDRFADYPFRVASLSRFKTAKEQKEILTDLKLGKVDIVIGTHRLFSKDVAFNDLGLVIVDEEQRFGVEHKQRLLALRMTAEVLTLSATPIPRTLHMSLLGLRDISSLSTAPLDRRSIVTEVTPYNERRIQQAIARELNRDGQVFFLHNRVHNIKTVADDIQKLVPDARILIGHGQMPARELESVMLKFMRKQADILVCTTIIESGIDIPTANTMIINDADRFGLAELHQLRGRVGRHKNRAYCYMLTPLTRTVTPKAKRRLAAIEEFSMLGAGFKIAMRDLEIRGAGNLLGPEQSGHIATVGYEMYCRLLEDAVGDLQSGGQRPKVVAKVELGVSGSIPKTYIPSDQRRLEAYRRISAAASADEVCRIEEDLTQAYGRPPGKVDRLLELSRIRVGSTALGATSVTRHEADIIFLTHDPSPIEAALDGAQGSVRTLRPRSAGAPFEIFFRPPASFLEPDSLLPLLRRRVNADSRAAVSAGG